MTNCITQHDPQKTATNPINPTNKTKPNTNTTTKTNQNINPSPQISNNKPYAKLDTNYSKLTKKQRQTVSVTELGLTIYFNDGDDSRTEEECYNRLYL